MELISIDGKNILLNSRMEELSFSKTNYDSVITQKGLIAISKNSPDGKLDFKFDTWNFDDIKAMEVENNKNKIVFYCGRNPFSKDAKTFLKLVDENNFFTSGYAICSMLTQAALEKINVPLVGAGGIIVDITKTETRLLLVPEDLYKFSAGGLPESDFTRIHAQWLNLTIYDLPAVCFMRAVIAYKMITDRMPYTAIDPLERNADLLDHKFIPIDLVINGINPKLAVEINKALKLNADVVKEPGKKKKGKDSEDLTPTPDFPLDLLLNSKTIAENEKLTKEEFDEKVKNFMIKQNSRIKFKRSVRRNKSLITVGIIGVVAAIFIGINIYTTAMDRYTGKGLSSPQVIETYLKAVNIKESNLLSELSKGKNVTNFNDSVSSIFVIGKMRQQYGLDQGFETPENWIMSIVDEQTFSRHSVYGATNLYIDGIYHEINPVLTKKKEHPQALTVQDNKELKNKDVITHQVEFDLIQTEGENLEIQLYHKKGTFTLTYCKDEWKITNIVMEENHTEINPEEFMNDYLKAFNENETNCIDAVLAIKEKYPWLPSADSIEQQIIENEEDISRNYFNLINQSFEESIENSTNQQEQ